MPWQVVEFLPHGKFSGLTVQAIPSLWVKMEGDTIKTYYPKERYNWASLSRAIKNATQPSEEWDILPVKFCTPPFETLEAAIEIERKMAVCEDTDLEAFVVSELNSDGKRKRTKKNLKYPDESSSSSMENGDDDDRIPKPPSPVAWVAPKKKKMAMTDSSPTNGGVRKETNGGIRKEMNVGVRKETNGGVRKEINSGVRKEMNGGVRKEMNGGVRKEMNGGVRIKETNCGVRKEMNDGVRKETSGGVRIKETNCGARKPVTTSLGVQCVPEEFDEVQLLARNEDTGLSWKDEVLEEIRNINTKFGKLLLEQKGALAEIKGKITDLESNVKDSRTSLSSSGSTDNEFRDLHSFPVTDLDALYNLQTTIIENDGYREYLICFLKERSSNILYKSSNDNQARAGLNRTVNDMCSTLMSNELAASFCMKGRSENKIAFEVHFNSIINVIFESVKAKHVPGALHDVVSVKRSIAEWFRVSKFRTEEGKQKRRAKIRTTSSTSTTTVPARHLEEMEFFV